MYSNPKKIPTLIGLLLLLIGIGGTIYLVETRTSSLPKAQTTHQPYNVLKTNLTDTSFTVTWLTQEAVTGTIIYGINKKSLSQIALDDRDIIDNKPKPYKTHHISVKNLSPNTTYYFIINSGNNKFLDGDNPYTITTAKSMDKPLELEPAYGTIITPQNQPAEGALVILTLPQALPVSTLVKPSGNWLIPLNTLRNIDLEPYQPQESILESLTIYNSLAEEDQAFATTDLNNDSPVPTITLGKSYHFQGLQGKKKIDQEIANAQINQTQILGSQDEKKQDEKRIDIFSPEDGATFISTKPLFRGKGIPGKQVIIEIDSSQKITGKTTINNDGLWSWTPPQDLPTEKQKAKFTTVDENGKEIVLERNFLVFKSGTQVLGEATPSGITTTIPTPTQRVGQATSSATLKSLLSPTPATTTSQKIPTSGDISITVSVIGIGLILILIGFAKITSIV